MIYYVTIIVCNFVGTLAVLTGLFMFFQDDIPRATFMMVSAIGMRQIAGEAQIAIEKKEAEEKLSED
jgi:uncharacterized membrane protein